MLNVNWSLLNVNLQDVSGTFEKIKDGNIVDKLKLFIQEVCPIFRTIKTKETKEKICIMCEVTEPHKMKIREIHCTECNTENCALKFIAYNCLLKRRGFVEQIFLNKLYI